MSEEKGTSYSHTFEVVNCSETQPIQYTGPRKEVSIGLYDDNARFYDPMMGRFTQADTIVPSPADPQSWDRYAYVKNNPLRYSDPSGHYVFEGDWQDPNSGTYSAGYNQHGNTILLSPNSSMDIYGSGLPIRVSYSTLIDPNNEFGIYAAGIFLGMVETGKNILPAAFSSRIIGYIPKNLYEDVFSQGGWAKFESKGSSRSGRLPANLKEQLCILQVQANPEAGGIIELSKGEMTDQRWLASKGWIKMYQNINGVEIHYVYNTWTGWVDDIKIMNPLP